MLLKDKVLKPPMEKAFCLETAYPIDSITDPGFHKPPELLLTTPSTMLSKIWHLIRCSKKTKNKQKTALIQVHPELRPLEGWAEVICPHLCAQAPVPLASEQKPIPFHFGWFYP